jgi:nitroimidazol reductase NimA-like FMN-containing flavoprotein (pyridoxamine 5'-phosphate oxidase superfamily)
MPKRYGDSFAPTNKTTLKRLPKRASYERRNIYGILDEAFVCHVGFIDSSCPVVIPMAYGRQGNNLYIHGSAASRMLRTASKAQVCLTVTLLDGLVLARSAFHHSINYRSVVVFGVASVVKERTQKLSALRAISEHVLPGRWEDVRKPNNLELRQTLVLSLRLTEASAKIRTGPPVDEDEDYELPVWAGEVPLSLLARPPVADPQLRAEIVTPDYVKKVTLRHPPPAITI